jgi:hypothetical protein
MLDKLDEFWEDEKDRENQMTLYEKNGAPPGILRIIALGGGNSMGTAMERFATKVFTCLQKRKKKEKQYDHIIKVGSAEIYVEQKSGAHWSGGGSDYKAQHIAPKHKWDMLLLCFVDYTNIHWYCMSRGHFEYLMEMGFITNQGSEDESSHQGYWFNYSAVKDHITEIWTNDNLLRWVADNCLASD